jgi:LmbE family N-acetylglucosaminyl deacetylase
VGQRATGLTVTIVALAAAIAASAWFYLRPRPRQEPPVVSAPPAAAASSHTSLKFDGDTRLLIIAPHPDDEILAAGGVIQQLRATDATVHVVYLTDGEGYPNGVKAERRHGKVLNSGDYRAYGRQREDEARTALRDLGYSAWSLTFLGFPNGGLNQLMTTYWSEHTRAYRSRYTRLNRPTTAEVLIPSIEYRGENLTQELAEIIGAFKPTIILVPREEDQHVDHCAAWFFVADALGDVERVHPKFRTDLITYIVHYNAWPFDHPGPTFPFPEDLNSGTSGWINVPLTPAQVALKRAALHRYKSQMDVTPWFLDGFARANEVFSRPAPPNVTLPITQNPCDEFIEH